MTTTETVTVTVRNGKSIETHRGISAIGVGHIRKDLVLVRPEGEPVDVGTNWTSYSVKRKRNRQNQA